MRIITSMMLSGMGFGFYFSHGFCRQSTNFTLLSFCKTGKLFYSYREEREIYKVALPVVRCLTTTIIKAAIKAWDFRKANLGYMEKLVNRLRSRIQGLRTRIIIRNGIISIQRGDDVVKWKNCKEEYRIIWINQEFTVCKLFTL